MDALFRELTHGVRFSRRHDEDVAAFHRHRSSGASSALPRSRALDFFGDASPAVGNPSAVEASPRSRKRRKSSLGGEEDAEESVELRRRLKIKVKVRGAAPAVAATFEQMPWERSNRGVQRLLRNVEQSDWKEPTAVQMQAIPAILSGRDVLAAAPTGSGKTAAFVLPVLAKMAQQRERSGDTFAVFLAPTRELAAQIFRESVRLGQGVLVAKRKVKIVLLGKAQAATAAAAAERGDAPLKKADIIVATPMRLVSVLRSGGLDLRNVRALVFDEADRLFDDEEGRPKRRRNESDGNEDDGKDGGAVSSATFLAQVDEVLHACGSTAQRALFSATVGPKVRELGESILRDPVDMQVGKSGAGADTIEQKLVFVGQEEGKIVSLRQLIQAGLRPPVLLFLQSKDRAQSLFEELAYDGLSVGVVHSGRTQAQRDSTIKRFRRGDIWLLICTDLMARGMDFKGVNMVINYDFPTSPVEYIHRIGRTGRAGKEGVAVTLFTEADMNEGRLRPIANVVRQSGGEVPAWMLSLRKPKTFERRRWKTAAAKRTDAGVSTQSAYFKRQFAKRKNVIEQSRQKKRNRKNNSEDAADPTSEQ